MKTTILIPLFIAAIFVAGCSTPAPSSPPPATSPAPIPAAAPTPHASALEGVWNGHEIKDDGLAPASITFSGQTAEFHGAEANDWVKGSFVLNDDANPKQLVFTATEGPDADTAGKKAYAIYKLEEGTLTITGDGPNDSGFPTAFDAPNTRQLVFTRQH